jgi:hypothetical protein
MINKDISLLILSYCSSPDDVNSLTEALKDYSYEDSDYRFVCILMYPKLFGEISDVLGCWIVEISWKEIFLALIDEINSESYQGILEKFQNFVYTHHIIKDDQLITYPKITCGNDCHSSNISSKILYNLIDKLLVKIKYPYLFKQIRFTYTLVNFMEESFNHCLYRDDPGCILDYLKTGSTKRVRYEPGKEFTCNITILSLLLRDNLVFKSLEDFADFIYLAGRMILIRYINGSSIFKNLTDFLKISCVSKFKLKEALDKGLIHKQFLREVEQYVMNKL